MPDASAQQGHSLPVRVYYEDTDAGGIVYYANYLKYAERARTELLRSHGIENGALMRSERIAFAVKSCSVDYIKPARLDDALDVVTTVTGIAGASIRMHQEICLDGVTMVIVDVRLACMDIDSGAPKRLPDVVRDALMRVLQK